MSEVETEQPKAFQWQCVCENWNVAPAIQKPENIIQCSECEQYFRWREITPDKLYIPRIRKK